MAPDEHIRSGQKTPDMSQTEKPKERAGDP